MKTDIKVSKVFGNNVALPVMESFATLQGEGYHSGKPAYFVRLGGCDVGCHWCDVKESWDLEAHPEKTVGQIIDDIKASNLEIVVITGGEPLMHDLDILTRAVGDLGKKLHVETSGAHSISGVWDWICFSPKKFNEPVEEFYSLAHELKIIVYNKSDFDFAEMHAERIRNGAKLFLQPEWSVRHKIMPLIVEYIKHNPKWRISLQTHKYLDIP